MASSKDRNDFYDLILDKQANIIQDGYAAMGIEVDIGTAEILASMFTSTPARLTAIASEILIPSKLAMTLTTKLGKREFRKYKKYLVKEKFKRGKMNPAEEQQFISDSLDKFLAIRRKQISFGKYNVAGKKLDFEFTIPSIPIVQNVYSRIDSIINGGRLVHGMQLDDAAKKISQRPEVVAAFKTKQNLIQQRADLQSKIEKQGGVVSLANEKLIAKMDNQLYMANTNLRAAVLESNLPRFLKDAARGNKYMIIGSASFGQIGTDLEVMGGDSGLLEAIGLFGGIAYDFNANNRVMSSLLKRAWSYTTAGKKAEDFDIARELAKRVNTFSPEFRTSLETRLQYLDKMRTNLITNAPNPARMEKLTKLSFAKLSGIAILDTVEETGRLNISQKGIASFGQTIEDLSKVQATKATLLNELSELSLELSQVRRSNPDDSALIKFQKTLDGVFEHATVTNKRLSDDIEKLKTAQADEITDFISGTTGSLDNPFTTADISSKLNKTYKLNLKPITWKNEIKISEINQKIQDKVFESIESKAKSLNRNSLLKLAKKDTKKALKKDQALLKEIKKIDDSGDADYDNFGDLMLTFVENKKNAIDANISKEYIKLDNAIFVDDAGRLLGKNPKAEGMNIFQKFLDVTGDTNDTSVFLDFAGGNIQSGKRATLFKGLDNAAHETLQSHFDKNIIGGEYENLNEYMDSILATAENTKDFLPKHLRVIEVINRDMASRGLQIDSLPLSFDQAKELKSAFSNLQNKYTKMAETGNNPQAASIANKYRQLRGESDKLFDNFKVDFGEKNAQLVSNMFVEIDGQKVPVKKFLDKANGMHQTYMNRYFDNKENWSKLFKGRNKVPPSSTRATGITLDNQPNNWFDFDKIGDFKSKDDIENFQKDFFELVGTERNNLYSIDLDSSDGKALKALMELKMADYILDLAANGRLNQEQYQKKLLNIQKAFNVGTQKGVKKSLIDVDKIEKDLFSYNPASVGDEIWKKGRRNLKTRMDNLAKERVITPATEYLDKKNSIKRLLENFTASKNPDRVLAQRLFESGSELDKLKKGILETRGDMSPKELDDIITDVFFEDLDKNVFTRTGRQVLDINGNLIPEMDMDVEILKDIIGHNNPDKRKLVANIMGEKRLKVFEDMVSFVTEESAKAQQKANITGVPRNFSVESYISRFYSINRGVISARYVGTEAVLQQFRLSGHKLFRALVENPEAGTLFMEIVKTGQPLSRQKEMQFFNYLTQVLSNQDKLFGTDPSTEITLPQGWKLKFKNEYKQDILRGDIGEAD